MSNITSLNKINIETYRNNHPKNYFAIKRISETEAFLVVSSPSKLLKADLLNEEINQGMNPEGLEIIPALTPDLSCYNGYDTDETLED